MTMNRKAFTLMEVIISCAVLALFITGLITLYSSGSKMTNSAMWLQNIASQLKNATRQINMSIQKSSYPTKIEYPGTIVECKNACFNVKYYSTSFKASSASPTGTTVLQTTEATPARTGGPDNIAPVLRYHIYLLKQNGDLIYSRYIDSGVSASNLTGDGFTRTIPSGKVEYTATLVRDVESIEFENIKGTTDSPLKVKINCAMKHSKTKRSEETIGVPNVNITTI